METRGKKKKMEVCRSEDQGQKIRKKCQEKTHVLETKKASGSKKMLKGKKKSERERLVEMECQKFQEVEKKVEKRLQEWYGESLAPFQDKRKSRHARVERVMKMRHKMHLISTALARQVKSQIYAACSCEVPPEPAKDKQLKAEGAQSDPGFSTIACSSNLQDLEQEMKKRVSLLLGREAKGACVVAVRAVRGLQTSVGRGGKNDMGKPECPIPSPRPLSLDGDYLLVAKKRKGHTCSSKYTAVLLVLKNFVDPEDQEKARGIVGRSMPSLMASRLESQRHVLTSRGGHPPCLCAVGKFGKTFGRAEVSKCGIQLKGEKNVDRGAQKSFLGLKMRKGAPGGRTVPLGCTTSANAYCKWRQTEEERVEGKKWEGCSNELKERILSLGGRTKQAPPSPGSQGILSHGEKNGLLRMWPQEGEHLHLMLCQHRHSEPRSQRSAERARRSDCHRVLLQVWHEGRGEAATCLAQPCP